MQQNLFFASSSESFKPMAQLPLILYLLLWSIIRHLLLISHLLLKHK